MAPRKLLRRLFTAIVTAPLVALNPVLVASVVTLAMPMLANSAMAQCISYPLLHTFNDPTVTIRDTFGYSVAVDGNNVLIGARGDDTTGLNVGQSHIFNATTGDFLLSFNDPTVSAQDRFGDAVAIDGNKVLIGAADDDTNGMNGGQAHLFDTSGNLLMTFSNPDPNVGGSNFGRSVAIDGNNVLIGAPEFQINGTSVGRAYLFDVTGVHLMTFDDPTPTNFDQFGWSVAIDGSNVLIGARGDNTYGNDVGQAHLFDTGGNLLQTIIDLTPTLQGLFGHSVAIDGNNLLIGNPNDGTNGSQVGQAYLFDPSGNLLQTFDRDPTVSGPGWFGFSVAIDGNNVLIGAPLNQINGTSVGQAYLFDATGVHLMAFDDPTPTDFDRFGRTVAIDGESFLVGANADDTNGTNVGQAHLFGCQMDEQPAQFYEYVAKAVCGIAAEELSDHPLGGRLERGAFSTTVNFLNLGDQDASIDKFIAFGFPPGDQLQGDRVPLTTGGPDVLSPGFTLESNCRDIENRRLSLLGVPLGVGLLDRYFEGFLIVRSSEELKATAVYTGSALENRCSLRPPIRGPLDGGGFEGGGGPFRRGCVGSLVTMDVEDIIGRQVAE